MHMAMSTKISLCFLSIDRSQELYMSWYSVTDPCHAFFLLPILSIYANRAKNLLVPDTSVTHFVLHS